MLRAASRAPDLLRDAGDRVAEFLRGQFNGDGGGKDRSGESDLYYTVFALQGLTALGVVPPGDATVGYLRGFGDGADLDLVHCACLARCWAMMPNGALRADVARGLLRRIESHRSADGGYGSNPGGELGTVYHCFLALGAYQDLEVDDELPNPEGLLSCVCGLQAADGAFANKHGLEFGTTPSTAAAAILMRQLDVPVPQTVGDWLQARCHDRGGFLATVSAPIPDMLSTATALHALAKLDVSLAKIRDACLDFVESLWTGRAFRGHWADDVEDCEYTYYALLALGHLGSQT
jgi:prenyltransferase beta subunit